MATKNGTSISVTLPFLRETKNTYLYAFDRETLKAMDPKPAITSIYIAQAAGPQREKITVVVT